MKKFTINGIACPYALNINALKNLSKDLGLKCPSDFDDKLKQTDWENPTFDDLDLIAKLIYYGVVEGFRKERLAFPDVQIEDILEAMQDDTDMVTSLFESYLQSTNVEHEKKPAKVAE